MNAIFAAIVSGAVLSALVTLAVWVGLRLAPRRALNAATRYGVWWATLAAAVVLPLLYLPPALWHPRPESGAEAGPGLAGSGAHLHVMQRRVPASAARAARQSLSRSAAWFPLEIANDSWPRWVLSIWAILAALLLIRLLASSMLLKGHKKRAADAPPHLAARVQDWTALCGCSRLCVRLAVSSDITIPMVAGLGRSSILVPARLIDELDAGEIDQIGLHEVAHLARGDDYAIVAQRAVEAVFVLHPVVRWIGRAIDLEREIACDDFVLNATGQARPYAACLARVVELTGGVRGSLTAAAVAEGRSHLSRRVDMLLDGARHTGTRLLKGRLAAAIAALALLVGVAGQAPGLLAFAPPVAPAAAPDPQVPAPQGPPAQLPAPAPRPAVQPEAPVKIAVTVQDEGNRYVTGLAAENFRVMEDGAPQTIAAFSSQDVPVSIGVLFDASGSMRTKLAEAQTAVAEFLDRMNPASQSFLITYNEAASVAENFTLNRSQIKNKIELVQPRGGTSLREAILLALRQMQNAPSPNNALLIISDGGPDNTSGVSSKDVEDAVSAAKVQIDAISFPAPGPATGARDNDRGLANLTQIAALTGGQHFVVAGEGPIPAADAAAAGIAQRNLYMIEYHPTNTARDGRYRRLRVELLPPAGLSHFTVNHRAGYYAPSNR